MTLTSFLVGSLFLSKNVINFLVIEAENKADICVYFQEDSRDQEIDDLKNEVAGLEGVKEVDFKSKEEVLEEFRARHEEDQVVLESLAEVGANPFLASLSIRADDITSFEGVSEFLKSGRFDGIIEKVDYHQRKPVLEKIFDLASFVRQAGALLLVVFISAAALVSFNTIRLAIKERKDEVEIMHLVGATRGFITGPFLVHAFLVGAASFAASFLVLAAASYFLTPKISTFFPGLRIFTFFQGNLREILLAQLGASLSLSIIPSVAAIQKYLRV